MAPPAAPKAAESQRNDDTRGRPHYEKLRKDLRHAIERKRDLDAHLAQVESNIAAAESRYLEETSAVGNIVKGFDNYIKASSSTTTSTGPGTATRRKGGVSDADRIFSRSSTSWNSNEATSSVVLNNIDALNGDTPSASHGHSGSNSARATPAASASNTNKGNKKKKAAERDKDDEADERPSKRQQVSWSRD